MVVVLDSLEPPRVWVPRGPLSLFTLGPQGSSYWWWPWKGGKRAGGVRRARSPWNYSDWDEAAKLRWCW